MFITNFLATALLSPTHAVMILPAEQKSKCPGEWRRINTSTALEPLLQNWYGSNFTVFCIKARPQASLLCRKNKGSPHSYAGMQSQCKEQGHTCSDRLQLPFAFQHRQYPIVCSALMYIFNQLHVVLCLFSSK